MPAASYRAVLQTGRAAEAADVLFLAGAGKDGENCRLQDLKGGNSACTSSRGERKRRARAKPAGRQRGKSCLPSWVGSTARSDRRTEVWEAWERLRRPKGALP